MYNIKLTDYVPEPQPATSDRIVAAHYYSTWKKGAAGLHNGFDDLHDYPERTPLMGYYDEENPEVCDWEIKWAVEHGINCFIHVWYRKMESAGRTLTPKDVRAGHGLYEALFNAKYQKYMKFAIMYENQPRWATTDAVDIVENLMPFWTEQYFSRENYLKIDNKPVLFVYHQDRLNEVFPNPADQKAAFDACREWAKNHGFDGMIFAVCGIDYTKELVEDRKARGYDFFFGYECGWAPEESFPSEEEVIAGQLDVFRQRLAIDSGFTIPTVTCFRDSEPRRTQHWADLGFTYRQEKTWHLSPDGFRKVVHEMKQITDALPDGAWGRKIFMIDNWNEWDEGHYVSPNHEFGFRYLQAIREELTERDNLPDYRTPQELGFVVNRSWNIPDLGPICEKKFGLKK